MKAESRKNYNVHMVVLFNLPNGVLRNEKVNYRVLYILFRTSYAFASIDVRGDKLHSLSNSHAFACLHVSEYSDK